MKDEEISSLKSGQSSTNPGKMEIDRLKNLLDKKFDECDSLRN